MPKPSTSAPAERRKPGPAKGSPGGPGRPAAPAQSLESRALAARCHVFPQGRYPGSRALAAALGMAPATWLRRLRGQGEFTPAQLAAGHALLDALSPARWPPPPATEEDFGEAPAD